MTEGYGGIKHRIITGFMAIAVLGALIGLGFILSIPRDADSYTEFYLLGPDGIAGEYPGEVRVGQDINLVVGVVSHEFDVTTYQVEVILNDNLKDLIGPVALTEGEKWEKAVSFAYDGPEGRSNVEFNLVKNGEIVPGMGLHLWLDVSG